MKKIMFILSTFIFLFFCNTVYANELVSKDIAIDANDFVTIASKGGSWKIDYRCLPSFEFEIMESKQGLLKEGKTVYFSTDSSFMFEKGLTPICENGSVEIQISTISNTNENINALHFKSITNEGKEPLSIRFSLSPYINRIAVEKKSDQYFPLYLITGLDYSDNLFQNKDNQSVLLNENFFIATSTIQQNKSSGNDLTRHVEIKLGQSYLTYDGKQVKLTAPAYMDENGIIMLPFKEIAENLGASVHVDYDDKQRAITVQIYSKKIVLPMEGAQYFVDDFAIDYLSPIVVRDGKAFLSIKDISRVLSIAPDAMVWNADTQILSFN